MRACWIGDRLTKEEAVSATDLAELARRSGLDRGTRYQAAIPLRQAAADANVVILAGFG